jgi:hypothetical protein
MADQTLDIKNVLAGLDRMMARISDGIDQGLNAGATLIETTDKETEAYHGMSGATRASSTAYVIGNGKDGSSEASAGYQAAVEALTGFTGHEGQALKTDSGITLQSAERGIILTTFTDYAQDLETANAGEKAHLGPSLLSKATVVTSFVASFSKQKLS